MNEHNWTLNQRDNIESWFECPSGELQRFGYDREQKEYLDYIETLATNYGLDNWLLADYIFNLEHKLMRLIGDVAELKAKLA